MRRRTSLVVLPAVLVLALGTGAVNAARFGGPAVRSGINRSPVLSPSLLRAGGRVRWAVVSRNRVWAVALIVPRPGRRRVQTAIVMLIRERAQIYQLVADILHQPCRGVPRGVRLEFRRFFRGPGRRLFLSRFAVGPDSCL